MIDLETCSDYQLLSTTEVAEALRISPASVRKLVRDGRLAAIGGFRVFYISAAALRSFIKTNGMEAPPIVVQLDEDDDGAETRTVEMRR